MRRFQEARSLLMIGTCSTPRTTVGGCDPTLRHAAQCSRPRRPRQRLRQGPLPNTLAVLARTPNSVTVTLTIGGGTITGDNKLVSMRVSHEDFARMALERATGEIE